MYQATYFVLEESGDHAFHDGLEQLCLPAWYSVPLFGSTMMHVIDAEMNQQRHHQQQEHETGRLQGLRYLYK